MAHFAEINGDNVVTRVIVVDNKDTSDAFGVEKEYIGAAFCEKLFGGTWKKTSYNNSFRTRFAGIGFTYNSELDAFIRPKPYSSWVLNNETADWEAPVAAPTEELTDPPGMWVWNEEITNWEAVYPE